MKAYLLWFVLVGGNREVREEDRQLLHYKNIWACDQSCNIRFKSNLQHQSFITHWANTWRFSLSYIFILSPDWWKNKRSEKAWRGAESWQVALTQDYHQRMKLVLFSRPAEETCQQFLNCSSLHRWWDTLLIVLLVLVGHAAFSVCVRHLCQACWTEDAAEVM